MEKSLNQVAICFRCMVKSVYILIQAVLTIYLSIALRKELAQRQPFIDNLLGKG